MACLISSQSRRRLMQAALLLAVCGSPAAVLGQGGPSVDAVKAAYLHKFRHYAEWPGKRHLGVEPVAVIGLVGADDVADALLQMGGASTRPGTPIEVRRLRLSESPRGINVLYVSAAYWPRAQALVEAAAAQGALVVSESEGALNNGSMLNFRIVDERLRFEIDLDTAERAGVKLSSQLAALALSVSRRKR
ncbi:YfiR family protein [Massilia sp. CMS3.1]|uniref:YfiR family protein n=1 Tax=Massilia sp. CMS3.1 TaxID=3373083 RepID=UPI003EE516F2